MYLFGLFETIWILTERGLVFFLETNKSGDLSFRKGQVIIVTQKSNDSNTWWKGKLDGKEGMFPANFVEVV